MKQPNDQIEVLNDDGTEKRTSKSAWTGTTVPTVFQINGEARKGFCMFSCHYAKNLPFMRQQRKKDKKSVSERDLSVHERALFQAPKRKELQSCRVFLSTMCGLFDTTENAIPERTLSARRLLTWSKNPDGSPRAKCHLIVRGLTTSMCCRGIWTHRVLQHQGSPATFCCH